MRWTVQRKEKKLATNAINLDREAGKYSRHAAAHADVVVRPLVFWVFRLLADVSSTAALVFAIFVELIAFQNPAC